MAYELRPVRATAPGGPAQTASGPARPPIDPPLPKAPAKVQSTEVTAAAVLGQIQGLASPAKPGAPLDQPGAPADFVCEDDVRRALRAGTTILVGEKTIITPSARDLALGTKVLVEAHWPRS